MLTAASKYTLYRRQSLLLPATDLARMNAILTSNFVHRLLLLQSLQGYSPLGLRAVTFTFYCHRFPFVVWTFFILVSGPKFGEYHTERNLAVELLEKLLQDNIKARTRNNVVQEKKYADRLQETLRKYNNRAIETAQVIEEMIQMAKDFQQEMQHKADLGLNPDEIAFYDALANNASAARELGDAILKKIAIEITEKLRQSTTVDWQIRDSVRAQLRILVRRTLQRWKYPPDKANDAIELVLRQAEVLSNSWTQR